MTGKELTTTAHNIHVLNRDFTAYGREKDLRVERKDAGAVAARIRKRACRAVHACGEGNRLRVLANSYEHGRETQPRTTPQA